MLPLKLNGIVLTWKLCGKSIEIEYKVSQGNSAPKSIECAGQTLSAEREANPYRDGGLIVKKADLEAALAIDSRITVTL